MKTARILVVDDEVDICELLRTLLGLEGYSVTVAENHDDALRRIHEENWDMVLLDVVMPDRDGWQLARAIRETRPELPVYFMTAKVDLDYDEAVREGVIHGYLYKPFAFDDIQDLLQQALPRPAAN